MADEFERLAVLIEANTKSYEKAMERLEAKTNRALRNSQAAVDSLNARFGRLQSTVSKVAGVFGVSFSAVALVQMAKRSIEAASRVQDLGTQLGMTAEEVQEFSFAAGQLGSSQEAWVKSMTALNRFMGDLERGSKSARTELKAIGLTIDDLKGKSPAQVFRMILDQLSQIEDPLQRNAMLLKFFGRSGLEMAEMAKIGGAGLDELREKARELGLVLSNEEVAKLEEAGDKLALIGEAGATAGQRLTAAFLPAIDSLANLVTSRTFQQGLSETAAAIAHIVKLFADNPWIVAALAGASIGSKLGGKRGALLGLVSGGMGGIMAQIANGEDPGLEEDDGYTSPRTVGDFADRLSPPRARLPELDLDLLGTADAAEQQRKKFDDLVRTLENERDAIILTNKEREVQNNLLKLGADATQAQRDKVASLTEEVYANTEAYKASADAAMFFAETAMAGLDQLLPKVQTGITALDMLIESFQKAILLGEGPLAGILGTASQRDGMPGGILGNIVSGLFGGFRAGGGPVSPGKAYVVGENRPEIFVPNTAGRVVNPSSGGVTIIQNNSFTNVDPTMRPWIEARLAENKTQTVAEATVAIRKGVQNNPRYFS